jgi:hypothetical protein
VVLDFSGCEVEDRALSALADLLNEAHVRIASGASGSGSSGSSSILGATRWSGRATQPPPSDEVGAGTRAALHSAGA